MIAVVSGSSVPLSWLAIGASVVAITTGLVKAGRWIGSVESRLSAHDDALKNLGTEIDEVDRREEELE